MMSRENQLRNIYGIKTFTFLIIIYLVNNFILNNFSSGFWGHYLIPAILWLLLGFYIITLPQYRPLARLRLTKFLCWLAVICGLGIILINWGIGFLVGFGKSPYNHSLIGVATNIFYLGSILVGMELSRAWLLKSFFKKRIGLGIGLISFVYSFFWFPFNRVLLLKEKFEVLRFIGETYFPSISENVLASYLALLGGPLPAITYRGILAGFEWFSPILPNLNWVMKALTGTLMPCLGLILVHQLYFSEGLRNKEKSIDNRDLFGWLIVSVVSVLMIWFSLGLFNIFPNAILTGSMAPKILPGDIVIVKKTSPERLKSGDIIQFKLENVRVNHRVVDLGTDAGGRQFFITKGDANENIDLEPVYPEQVTGKIVYVIPKLGWITIMARSAEEPVAVDWEGGG